MLIKSYCYSDSIGISTTYVFYSFVIVDDDDELVIYLLIKVSKECTKKRFMHLAKHSVVKLCSDIQNHSSNIVNTNLHTRYLSISINTLVQSARKNAII